MFNREVRQECARFAKLILEKLSEIKTDILIIGGGIAGCIAAIALADTFNVTLIDKLLEPKEKIGESLAPAANRILGILGLSKEFDKLAGSAFINNLGMQSYWGSDRVQIVDHLRNPDGFVKSLNRKVFERFLRDSAEKRGVQCYWNTKLFSCSYDSEWEIIAKTNDGASKETNISATFVIDASGRQSHFARSLEIKREVVDKLIACWITLPNDKENIMSTISSGENGWWYSAIVPNNKRVVAFHTDSDLIDKNELRTKESFLKLISQNREMVHLIEGKEESISFQGTVSANSTRLHQVAGKNWAALGDAAISFDPLSSQGMFNAMASAMQLRDLFGKKGPIPHFENIYTSQIDQIWQQYLNHRLTFYRSELRWPNSKFWKRRHLGY